MKKALHKRMAGSTEAILRTNHVALMQIKTPETEQRFFVNTKTGRPIQATPHIIQAFQDFARIWTLSPFVLQSGQPGFKTEEYQTEQKLRFADMHELIPTFAENMESSIFIKERLATGYILMPYAKCLADNQVQNIVSIYS